MPKDRCHLVIIHGLAQKPPKDKLLDIWIGALDRDNPKPEVFGTGNPGLRVEQKAATSLAYWADIFYTDFETDLSSYEEAAEEASSFEGVNREFRTNPGPELPKPTTDAERRFLEGFTNRLGYNVAFPDDTVGHELAPEEAYGLERVPLPLGLKKAIIRKAAMEAYHYLFDKPFTRSDGKVFPDVRRALQDRLINDLKEARNTAERVVIVSHSMGTMISYDCLRNREDCPTVHGLVTLGSPLGVDEVQDGLIPKGAITVDFPQDSLLGEWVNVYDRLDVVCAADPKLANDFLRNGQPAITDINEQNWGEWRHTITHYLQGPKFRQALRRLAAIS